MRSSVTPDRWLDCVDLGIDYYRSKTDIVSNEVKIKTYMMACVPDGLDPDRCTPDS